MESLLNFVENTIKTSPGRCIICGDALSHTGLKPTVCDKQLCVFSHEQYGLGVDLESAIKKYPEIVDLMITMCCAASIHTNYRFNPFNPYPLGLEVKIRNDKNEIETHNFLDEKGERNNPKVKKVIDLIPTLEVLSSWVDQGKLKENCDKAHPLLYGLLRWIMASNRSHLKKLEKHEQISEMNTSHQYLMMSSPPEKERKFQELKKKYGSTYCFHGSALGNWHSIMRVGLRNMSGTDGQINGAAYGSGVYMAPHSSTSAGYMQFYQGWPSSASFKSSLGCMAVCELILKKDEVKDPFPHYVVPNEDLIQTRYFMVYEGSCGASVDGGKLKPPKINWE
jgi:poly [ADP-ribose] polymerase 6/8